MPPKFELVEASFGKDTQNEIRHFLHSQLEWLITAHRQLHDVNIPLWRRLYHGIPAEKTKNFPFPNCANTVVQVVGETVDSMVARVMGLVYATHPLWVFQNYIKGASMDEEITDVAPFVKARKINYPIILNGSERAPTGWPVPGLPSAFLVGRDGKILARYFGSKSITKLTADVKAALAR